MPEIAPIEHAKTPENAARASGALVVLIANGESDPAKVDALKGKQFSPDGFKRAGSALDVVHDQQRLADVERVKAMLAKKGENLSNLTEEQRQAKIRDEHQAQWASFQAQAMIMCAAGASTPEMAREVAKIFHEKLNLPTNLDEARGHFYDFSTKKDGAFYKNFCTGNTTEKLSYKLSADEMRAIQPFLRVLLGSDDAVAALIAYKESKDIVAAGQLPARLQEAPQLSPDEQGVLNHFQKGYHLLSGRNPTEPPSPPQQPKPAEQQKPKETQPTLIGKKGFAENPLHTPTEDVAFIDEKRLYGGIFDEAGGHSQGGAASRAAQEAVQAVFANAPRPTTFEDARKLVEGALQEANNRVMHETGGKGVTTASVFYVVEGTDGKKVVVIGHVGDSRIWRRNANGKVEPLTGDQNLLTEALLHKLITPEQAVEIRNIMENAHTEEDLKKLDQYQIGDKTARVFWEHRNDIINSLGNEQAQFPVYGVGIEAGDMLFLTTDGVHDNLSAQQIQEIVSPITNPQALAEALVARAKTVSVQPKETKARAKPDDITAAALLLESSGTTSTEPSAPLALAAL